MSDEINQETNPNTQNDADQNSTKEHAVIGHLPQKTVWFYTVGYGLGAILIGVAFAVFGFNIHIGYAIASLLLGIAVFAATAVVHYFKAKHADGPPPPRSWKINWRGVAALLLPPIVILGGFFLLARFLKTTSETAFERGFEQARMARLPPAPTNATQALPNGRILLLDVVPEHLKRLYSENTTVDANKLMSVYWNKWIIVTGHVDDVSNLSTFSSLYIDREQSFSFGRQQAARFRDPVQIERIQPLKKGNPVSVLCRIADNVNDFELTDCELQ